MKQKAFRGAAIALLGLLFILGSCRTVQRTSSSRITRTDESGVKIDSSLVIVTSTRTDETELITASSGSDVTVIEDEITIDLDNAWSDTLGDLNDNDITVTRINPEDYLSPDNKPNGFKISVPKNTKKVTLRTRGTRSTTDSAGLKVTSRTDIKTIDSSQTKKSETTKVIKETTDQNSQVKKKAPAIIGILLFIVFAAVAYLVYKYVL